MLGAAAQRVIEAVARAGAWLAGASLCLIVGAYVWEIVARFVFDAPTRWVADGVSYLMCAAMFLALPQVTSARAHISVTLLTDRLPRRWAGGIEQVLACTGLVACLAMAGAAGIETYRQWTQGVQTVATVPIPKACLSACVVFGFAWSGLCFGVAMMRRVRAAQPS